MHEVKVKVNEGLPSRDYANSTANSYQIQLARFAGKRNIIYKSIINTLSVAVKA